MFCQKCGTQNSDNANFCSKCGNVLIKIGEAKKEEINANQEPRRKSSGWRTIFIIIIGLALLIGIFGLHDSPANTVSQDTQEKITPEISSQTPDKTSLIITIPPSQMLPTINDMPEGTLKASETANETYAKRSFVFNGYNVQQLSYEAQESPSIIEATNKYNSIIKYEYSIYKLNSVDLGDEGVGFEVANKLATVLFRKANVVVKVESVGQYSTLENTVSHAKMVNISTSTLKLVADKITLTKGEIWDAGNGYTLKVMDIDLSTPRTVLIELDRNGTKLDLIALPEGKTYIYDDVYIANVNSISDAGVVFEHTKT
jgi:hypothetical protein